MKQTLKINFFILIIMFVLSSVASANSGYFLCTQPMELIDGVMALKMRSPMNLSELKKADQGEVPAKGAYYALNFLKLPYQIEARDEQAPYQSGQRVYRSRELQLMKSVIGTHSGVTLYKTVGANWSWDIATQSRRVLKANSLPWDLNFWGQGQAYVIVGRKVGLIGFTRDRSSVYSLCTKQNKEQRNLSETEFREAFHTLLHEYDDRIKSHFSSLVFPFDFQTSSHRSLEESQREIIVRSLSDFFGDANYVFKSQYGQHLAAGAFVTGSGILMAKLLSRVSNPAFAILPPEIVDMYFMRGKTVLTAPEDSEVDYERVQKLFTENSVEEIVEIMSEDPRLEAYLHQLLLSLLEQTHKENSI